MSENIDRFLRNDRKDFQKDNLSELNLPKDPIELFKNWLNQAIKEEEKEAYAMVLSTVMENKPKARVVYLRGFDSDRLVFYTNYNSSKGKEIEKNGHVSITFYWPRLQRQVRISGFASKVSEEMSNNYFNSRPRESQIGAWSSAQSAQLENRIELDEKVAYYKSLFEGKEVERPPHWGGYGIEASAFEFWQGRKSRLHDRISYSKTNDENWKIERLSP